MKYTAALKYIFLFFLTFFFVPRVFAQNYIEMSSEGVTVEANINVDFYSTVNANPITVEIGEPSNVEIRVLSPSGLGISGRQIAIVSSGLNITQPVTLTNATGRTNGSVYSNIAGTYTVCAKDTTFGYDIVIQNCKTLYVVPVPIPSMLPEPQYTKSLSNMVMWSSLGSSYRYNVQVSEFSDFNTVLSESGYTTNTSYEFNGLEDGKMYFYRVRAQNEYDGVSSWSNIVYSVQDNVAPAIEVLDLGNVGENDTVNWSGTDIVTMIFRVSDNLQLASAKPICITSYDMSYDCTNDYVLEGDILTINIRLGNLERVSGVYLRDTYEFCIEASDTATNITKMCDIRIDIPQGEYPVEPAKPPVIDRIEKGLEDLDVILDNTIGKLDPTDLDRVSTTTSIVTATSAIAIAAGSFGSIPYFLLQLFLNLLSWLGFRKGLKPVGFVYDSVTKEPIPQAIVRIFDEENRIVWSDVTDSKGYFSASLRDGKYRIVVRVPGYLYPSNVVFGKEDYPLTNVYHGEEFTITSDDEPNFAVPLDPLEISKLRISFETIWARFKFLINILHVLLFVFGLVFALYTYYNFPSTLSLIVLLLYIPSFFFILRYIFVVSDEYGIVKNKDGERLEGVVVGLRESEFDKIIAKRVTDSRGRYRFLVDEGRYYIEILDTGYKVEDIESGDEVLVKKEELITRDIVLSRIEE